jgi:hypothetical protein
MAFPLRDAGADSEALSPGYIARHRLFTAREKIDLLEELRVGVVCALASEVDPGFSPSEIDRAIDQVRRSAARGESRPAGARKRH